MSKKLNKIIIFGIILSSFVILQGFTEILKPIMSKYSHITGDDIIPFEKYDDTLKISGFWNLTGSNIFIDNSDSNYDWSKTSSENDWCSGSGTGIDPYVIENVIIDGRNNGYCIEIKNSNVHFIIRNCSLYNSGIINFFDRGATIKFYFVSNGKILNNELFNNSLTYGIHLFYSDNNVISGNNLYNNDIGLYISWSEDNNIENNTIENNNVYGCYLDWGKNNQFSNNNFSFCGFGMEGNLDFVSSHQILTSNLVNRKPVYYFVNNISLIPADFLNAGQVILVNCKNSLISNINVSYSSMGIGLYFCEEITLTMINSSYCGDRGIYLKHSNNNTIYNNVASWNGHETGYHDRGGIALSQSSYNNITENQAHLNSKGIHMQLGQNNEITRNFLFENTQCGISLDQTSAVLIENEMKKCGIEVTSPSYSKYVDTTIDTSNYINNKPIYFYKNTNGLTPDDFLNAGQIILVNCNDSKISNVNVSNGSCGIIIYDCHNIKINNCNSFYNSIFGIQLFGYNCTISNSTMKRNNEMGLEVLGEGNYIINNQLENNQFESYRWGEYPSIGIRVRGDYTYVINNSVKYSYDGIYLFDCSNCYFIGNLIQNNSRSGVFINSYNRENNTFFNNYFINNGKHALDLGSSTRWNSPEIGNFWDNYTGSDFDDDGIGDISHIIALSPLIEDSLPIWDDGDDITPPELTIESPNEQQVIGHSSPQFELSTRSLYIDSMWYTIDGGLNNYTITQLSGTINQEAWDASPQGNVAIVFYAIDFGGNIGYSEVVVEKVHEDPPDIPIISFGNYHIIFMLISLFSLILLMKVKAKHNRSST